jgi:hypothetical protein
MLSPTAVAIYRIVLTESLTYPHLAQRYTILGPERVRATVRLYLEDRMRHGEVRDVDADWAATYFAEMIRARHLFAAMTESGPPPPPEEIRASVARAVDILLNGLKPR